MVAQRAQLVCPVALTSGVDTGCTKKMELMSNSALDGLFVRPERANDVIGPYQIEMLQMTHVCSVVRRWLNS